MNGPQTARLIVRLVVWSSITGLALYKGNFPFVLLGLFLCAGSVMVHPPVAKKFSHFFIRD